jgi:hypothetical protein
MTKETYLMITSIALYIRPQQVAERMGNWLRYANTTTWWLWLTAQPTTGNEHVQ